MKNQSNHSFEEILDSNKEKIYRICKIYAVSPIEPVDLFQEVIYQIWRSLENFQNKAQISTWVYKIALNVCIRSKMSLEKKNLKAMRLEAIEFLQFENEIDEAEKEKYRFLRECINLLTETEQSIIILFLEELAYKEISTITGFTENHIAVKMKRIKKKLFECITPKIQ